MDVSHTAIWVSDMDEAISFFVDGVGLEKNWSFTRGEVENVYVGGEHGEIQLKYSSERGDPSVDQTGHDHIGIAVDDVDRTLERVRDTVDITVLTGPIDVPEAGSRVVFFEGFDDYVIEFVQQVE